MKRLAKPVTYAQYRHAILAATGQEVAWSFSLPPQLVKFVATIKQVLKQIADQTGAAIADIGRALAHKQMFAVLKAIGFNLKKLLDGFGKLMALMRQGLTDVFRALEDKGVLKHLASGAHHVDEFLDHHPVLRKLIGSALAAFLFWVWLNMAFVGDPAYDFDLSSVVAAFSGRYTIYQFFASPDALTTFTFLAAGFLGFGVQWLGATIPNLIVAMVATGFKMWKDSAHKKQLQPVLKLTRLTP